jgi:glutaredoxin
MRPTKNSNSSIPYLLTLFALTNVIGCSKDSPEAKIAPNTTSAITASPVVDNTTQNKPKRTFTPEIVKAYVEGCQTSGGTKSYCNCFIGKIKVAFTPDEFDKAGESFKLKGKIPDAIAKSMKACEPAPVPTKTTTNSATNQLQNSSYNVATTSSNAERDLALHLKKIGAVLYGTYWCPYCTKQKQSFGEAISEIQYIECDPRGNNPRPEMCDSFGVRSYPTWQINGQSYSGNYPLKDIAAISGYTGSRNFKY